MAAKGPIPRFLLGPDTKVPTMDPSAPQTKDPKAQKEKMNMFKRHLAANRLRSDDAIRRKMELIKEQRSLSNLTKTNIQKDIEAEAKARVEEELGRPVSSKDWPFIYFVVALDQVPQLADEANPEQSTRTTQTARERQRFLTSRRKKIQETREETERIREANIDMGLRLEPIKPVPQSTEQQKVQRMRTRPSLTKHPTTPASSIGSRAPDYGWLNSQDDLTDAEMTRRSIGMIINDTLSQVGLGAKGNKQCPVSNLELPEISAGTKRKALGTTPAAGALSRGPGLGERKMVTFAEGLPVIKGNGIPVVGVKQVDVVSSSPSLQNSLSKAAEANHGAMMSKQRERLDDEYLRPPWSAPLTTRSMNSITPRSRLYAPMALPKIDIVSEIYDELIVKTIQNYLLAEGYSQEKFHQLRQTVLARLSATYPHLVKHKAWRQGHWAADEPDIPEAEPGMTEEDTDRLRIRVKSNPSRPGRSFAERGLSTFEYSHNLRPFTCPYFASQVEGDLSTPTFMSIDGRTMTITPRDDPRYRHKLGSGSVSVTPFSPAFVKLQPTNEMEEEAGNCGGEVNAPEEQAAKKEQQLEPFVIPGENY